MVVYRGLMENPNNRAMLGTNIRRQADASALGPIVRGGQAARIPTQRPIVLPADDSVGRGLSQLGKSLTDINKMNKEKAASDAVSSLFQPAPSEADLLEGVEPSARIPSADQMLQVGLMHPGTQAGKQALMLGGQMAQRESDQGFRREMLDLTQTFQDKQRRASEEARKALQDDKFAFLSFQDLFRRNTQLDIKNIDVAGRIEVQRMKNQLKPNDSLKLMTFKEYRTNYGSSGMMASDSRYDDNDPVALTLNKNGVPTGVKILNKDFGVSTGGAVSKSDAFKVVTDQQKQNNTPPPTNDGRLNADAPGGGVKMDFKAATGFITSPLTKALDTIGAGIGVTKGSVKAADDFLKKTNNAMISVGGLVNPILKKISGGRETDLTRRLTQQTLPDSGMFTSTTTFANSLDLTISEITTVVNQLQETIKQTTDSKERNTLRGAIVALKDYRNKYEFMRDSLNMPSTPTAAGGNLSAADRIVGFGSGR